MVGDVVGIDVGNAIGLFVMLLTGLRSSPYLKLGVGGNVGIKPDFGVGVGVGVDVGADVSVGTSVGDGIAVGSTELLVNIF